MLLMPSCPGQSCCGTNDIQLGIHRWRDPSSVMHILVVCNWIMRRRYIPLRDPLSRVHACLSARSETSFLVQPSLSRALLKSTRFLDSFKCRKGDPKQQPVRTKHLWDLKRIHIQPLFPVQKLRTLPRGEFVRKDPHTHARGTPADLSIVLPLLALYVALALSILWACCGCMPRFCPNRTRRRSRCAATQTGAAPSLL